MKISLFDKIEPVKQFLILTIISLVAISCATKKDQEFLELNAEEAEANLKIDKKKLKNFEVKKVLTPKKVTQKKPPKKSKAKKVVPKKKVKLVTKKKDEASSQKKSSETKNQKVKETLRPGHSYPKGYPDNFKNYDKLAKKAWELFEPKVYMGEKFTFEVAYLGITAGYIQMETMPLVEIDSKTAFHFKARMKSARYYSAIYTLDDSLEIYTTVEDFIPLKYVLMQRESAQKVDDLQLFDRQKLKTYHFYKRLKRGKKKELELEKPIPYFFQDSYSALHFVRGFPLEEEDEYEFPIVTRGKIWILKIKVEGHETIDVNGKDVKAIRLNAQTRFPGVLEKKGDIIFWYSADQKKRLLKFEAQVKIGAVSGELVDYRPGTPLEDL